MKVLDGKQLAEYIEQRQAKQIRSMQHSKIVPTLKVIHTLDDPVINKYIALKKSYADDIGAKVESELVDSANLLSAIEAANTNESIHGIIVQLPIADQSLTDQALNTVNKDKDVDGLGNSSNFDPVTPTAILWLLAGYNVSLQGKKITVIGQGRLVGKHLTNVLTEMEYEPQVIDINTPNPKEICLSSDIVVSAVGKPGLVKGDWLQPKAVVVDAGTTSEGGKILGDLHQSVYARNDLIVTPKIGGVGPLTIAVLFENLITAATA